MEYKVWNTALEANVAAVNMANEYANDLWQKLHDAFLPFVGTKIFKADGEFVVKVKEMVKNLNLPFGNVLNVNRLSSEYSLAYQVKVCQGSKPHNPHHADHNHGNYYTATVYLGNLEKGILKDLDAKWPNFNAAYSVDEVRRLRAANEVAKKAAQDALAALHPFGEYDR